MNTGPGNVFSLVKDHPFVDGCTISSELLSNPESFVLVFSMGPDTDISAETYQQPKLYWVLNGAMNVDQPGAESISLETSEAVWLQPDRPIGTDTKKGAIYLEIAPERMDCMSTLTPGEVFKLADLVPYQKGSIVNRDVFKSPTMKFVVMAFDEGTGLTEHAAPGEALLFGLEGKAVVNYEGKDHVLSAGEQMLFAKNGRHSVKADGPFKMALLINLA